MKTIRFKVAPTQEQIEKFDELCLSLTHVWNLARAVALHNHSLKWWGWAEKKVKEKGSDFAGADLTECIRTSVFLGKRSPWVGASCQIAYGGGSWKKDPKATVPIWERIDGKGYLKAIKEGKETRQDSDGQKYIRGYEPLKRFVPDKTKPWTPIPPAEFTYIRTPSADGDGTEMKTLSGDMEVMGNLKKFDKIKILKNTSDYVRQCVKDLDRSYKAWSNKENKTAHKPKGRNCKIKSDWVQSAGSPQVGDPKFVGDKVELGKYFGAFELFPGEADRVPPKMMTRTYRIVKDASGWYVCVVFATPLEARLSSLGSKKGKKSPEEKAEIADLQTQLDLERYNPGNGKVLGIDPGVIRNMTCYDGTRNFHIKLKASRAEKNAKTEKRIEQLQRKLSKVKTANNKRLGLPDDQRRSAGFADVKGNIVELKNEAKLAQKIARLQLLRRNCRNAYQHRIATRLFKGGYSEIRIEKTQTSNMTRKAKSKMAEDGSYAPNGGSAKTGLNKALADAAISAQREKLAARFTPAGRTFTLVSAAGTSSKCRECGGKHEQLERFVVCRTSGCSLEGIQQDRDDAAAQHIWQRADR